MLDFMRTAGESISQGESVRELGLLCLEKRPVREHLINVCKYLKGKCREEGTRLCLVVPTTGTQGNRQKLMHVKSQLNIRKNFPVWVTKGRNEVPRGVESFLLDIFQILLGTVLCHVL